LLGHSREVTIGAVRVAPGDWVVADADGIVVVPAAACEETLERAEAIVTTESEVRAAVRAGTLPREAFERYGKF
jgi:regulator of RNase E activity RraA